MVLETKNGTELLLSQNYSVMGKMGSLKFLWVSEFSWLEWSTGLLEWNTGLEYWTGLLDWPGLHAHVSTYLYTYLERIAQSLRNINMSEEACQQLQMMYYARNKQTKIKSCEATKHETLHNITSYNKSLIVRLKLESGWILQTSLDSVFHKLQRG